MDKSQELGEWSGSVDDASTSDFDEEYSSDTSTGSFSAQVYASSRNTAKPTWAMQHPLLYSLYKARPSPSTRDQLLYPTEMLNQEAPSPTEDEVLENLQIYDKSLSSDAAAVDDIDGPRLRLLQINPGSPHQQISCNLILRPVFDAPAYIALSYSWGTTPPSTQIFIGDNAIPFPVTAHLWEAFWLLRHAREVVTVWVDTICINQQSLPERAAQVQIMAQIYNQASEVRVWLGGNTGLEDTELPNEVLFLELCKQPNPWWTRLWVVQECAYARTCPVVMLGARTVTMEAFLEQWTLAAQCYEVGDVLGRRKLLADNLTLLRMPYDAWKLQTESNTHRLPLLTRMRETANRQCSDPHDRVYAILSLVDEKEAIRIPPDYSKPCSWLSSTVEALLKQSPDWDPSDVNLLNLDDRTLESVPWAVENAPHGGKTDALQELIANAPDHLREDCEKALQATLSKARAESAYLLLVTGRVNGYGQVRHCKTPVYECGSCKALTIRYNNVLQFASHKGYLETVRLLLKYVDHNIREDAYNNTICGALCAASDTGQTEVVKLLLCYHFEAVPKGSLPLKLRSVEARMATSNVATPRVAFNAHGNTYIDAIFAASRTGHTETVKILLDRDDTGATGPGGKYGNALRTASRSGYTEIVKLLLEKDIVSGIGRGGTYDTALQAASLEGHAETVKLLVEHGAEVDAHGGVVGRPLYAASSRGHTEVVKLLLECGAQVDARGGFYGTPLHVAAQEGHVQVLQLLLENGAEVNAQGGIYGRALPAASLRGHTEIVKLLLEHGAKVNAQDHEDGNALYAASSRGHTKVVKLLLENGAEVNAQGGFHGTALHAASLGDHAETVELLLANGAEDLREP